MNTCNSMFDSHCLLLFQPTFLWVLVIECSAISYFVSSFANFVQVKYQILKKNIVVIILTRKKLFWIAFVYWATTWAIIKVYRRMEADNHYHRHHYYPSWTTYLMLQHFRTAEFFWFCIWRWRKPQRFIDGIMRQKADKVALNFTIK